MAKKKKWFRIERSKKKRSRTRIIIFGKPVFGVNSHELPRAKKRGDKRLIRHVHVYGSKRHIPLDLKYLWYVISDAWKGFKRRFKKRNRKKDRRT